ncbi:MAG: transglutaminase family protein [Lysobacterales bacterium]
MKHSKHERIETYLRSTPTIDSDSEPVLEFVGANSPAGATDRDRAVTLYYAVRDQIRYDPYTFSFDLDDYRASHTLAAGRGWCVKKAILYAACCRAAGIPARLGYADVRNHLSTENLTRLMGTDIFYWHGYTEVCLDGQWLKATPVFNRELCAKFRLRPLEFDGRGDSIYHPYDLDGRQHMEYLHYHGVFADLPFAPMMSELKQRYPRLRELTRGGGSVWQS